MSVVTGEILLLEQQTCEADRTVEGLKQSVDTVKEKVCPLIGCNPCSNMHEYVVRRVLLGAL